MNIPHLLCGYKSLNASKAKPKEPKEPKEPKAVKEEVKPKANETKVEPVTTSGPCHFLPRQFKPKPPRRSLKTASETSVIRQ